MELPSFLSVPFPPLSSLPLSPSSEEIPAHVHAFRLDLALSHAATVCLWWHYGQWLLYGGRVAVL